MSGPGNYIVNSNAQWSGEHEVHNLGKCTNVNLPLPQNRVPLGWHPDCASAVRAARAYYSNVDGCKHCAEACHSR